MKNVESPQLMVGDAETGRSLVDDFEQMRVLAKSIKAKGKFTPEDVRMALDLVTSAHREIQEDEKIVTSFDISAYSKRISSDQVHDIGGQRFYGLNHQIASEGSDIMNTDGSRINKFTCDTNIGFQPPIIYKGKPVFIVKYSEEHDGVIETIVDESGNSVGLPSVGKNGMLVTVEDDDHQLKYYGTFAQRRNGSPLGQLFDLNKQPVTEGNLSIRHWKIYGDKLAYWAEDVHGNKVIGFDGQKQNFDNRNQHGEQEFVSLPFLYEGKPFFYSWSGHPDPASDSYIVQLKSFDDLKTLSSATVSLNEKVQWIEVVGPVGSRVYSRINLSKTQYVCYVDHEVINVLPNRADQKLIKVDVVSDKLVRIFKNIEKRGGLEYEHGQSVVIDENPAVNVQSVAFDKILGTTKPVSIGGKRGQVIYLSLMAEHPNIMVDNQPVQIDLDPNTTDYAITNFDIVNDVIFCGIEEFDENEERRPVFLYVNGEKTECAFDKIIKVSEGDTDKSFFVTGVIRDKMVVKRFKL